MLPGSCEKDTFDHSRAGVTLRLVPGKLRALCLGYPGKDCAKVSIAGGAARALILL